MKRIAVIFTALLLVILCGCTAKVSHTAAELEEMGYIAEDESGRMFDASGRGIYNYCPSIFEADDGVRHIYYCTNRESYEVYDHIGYRSAIKASDTGVWYYGPESLVLAPLEKVTVRSREDYEKPSFCWYSLHICDPSVIRGEFEYYGESYGYLMAVLVCANPECLDNEIALAVANSPEGPWTLCDDSVNPIVQCSRFYTTWGVGQPEIISADKKGTVWMLFTCGSTTAWQMWNLSNLNEPVALTNMRYPTNKGTEYRTGKVPHDLLNGAYAWDDKTDTLYMITEKYPHTLSSEPTYPDQVGTVQELFYFDSEFDTPMDITENAGKGQWVSLRTVGPEDSGKPRNHNACIIRDEWGHIDGSKTIELAVTVNDAGNKGDNNTYLWDYRIARFEYKAK